MRGYAHWSDSINRRAWEALASMRSDRSTRHSVYLCCRECWALDGTRWPPRNQSRGHHSLVGSSTNTTYCLHNVSVLCSLASSEWQVDDMFTACFFLALARLIRSYRRCEGAECSLRPCGCGLKLSYYGPSGWWVVWWARYVPRLHYSQYSAATTDQKASETRLPAAYK